MASWLKSDVRGTRLEALAKRGLLRARSAAMEWQLPGGETVPSPPDGYIVSFAPFLRGLLHYYNIELQHLNPNGIQHIALFVALCEGFLGIEPHFDLWRYFFAVSLVNAECGLASLGCAGIHLRGNRSAGYVSVKLRTSHRGWHGQWFYLKNDAAGPLPEFTGRVFEVAPESWRWGPPKREQTLLDVCDPLAHELESPFRSFSRRVAVLNDFAQGRRADHRHWV